MISSSLRSPAWYSPRIFGMSVVGLQSPNRLPFTLLRNRVKMVPGSWMVCSISLFSPVTTTTPPLPIALNPAPTTSAVMRSTVRMAESAPCPRVIWVIASCASSAVANAWVAPSSIAFSRLFSSGSMANKREKAIVLQRVDGDDVLRAGVASALHRVDADAADAVDRDRVAGRDVRGVHRGSPSGRHPAADERGLVQGQVVVDLDGGGLADHAVLAEGPDHAHRAVLATGPGNREALAGEVTLQDGGAHVADGLPAGGTVAAHAAVRDEGTHHVIARSGAGDARPDLLDDPAPSCPSTIGSRASRSPWAMWTSEWHRPAWV